MCGAHSVSCEGVGLRAHQGVAPLGNSFKGERKNLQRKNVQGKIRYSFPLKETVFSALGKVEAMLQVLPRPPRKCAAAAQKKGRKRVESPRKVLFSTATFRRGDLATCFLLDGKDLWCLSEHGTLYSVSFLFSPSSPHFPALLFFIIALAPALRREERRRTRKSKGRKTEVDLPSFLPFSVS